mmetsp:Transcript_12161/g.21990  ORF Transcript_12161/g.21990 Transcript_12161/m.21990 type:complete len:93 (-) Transcript_12161:1670-1948(-)
MGSTLARCSITVHCGPRYYFAATPKRSLYSSSFLSFTKNPYGTLNPNMTAAAKSDLVNGLAPTMFVPNVVIVTAELRNKHESTALKILDCTN